MRKVLAPAMHALVCSRLFDNPCILMVDCDALNSLAYVRSYSKNVSKVSLNGIKTTIRTQNTIESMS